MKIFWYIIAAALAFIGFLFIAFSSSLIEPPNTPVKTTALGVVFISWAYLLKEYISTNYSGGATSIIGAILCGFGLYMSPDIYLLTEETKTVEIVATYITVGLLIVGGLVLLFQGQRIHKSKLTHNKAINADTKPYA